MNSIEERVRDSVSFSTNNSPEDNATASRRVRSHETRWNLIPKAWLQRQGNHRKGGSDLISAVPLEISVAVQGPLGVGRRMDALLGAESDHNGSKQVG